jgi:hypothetical protein
MVTRVAGEREFTLDPDDVVGVLDREHSKPQEAKARNG